MRVPTDVICQIMASQISISTDGSMLSVLNHSGVSTITVLQRMKAFVFSNVFDKIVSVKRKQSMNK